MLAWMLALALGPAAPPAPPAPPEEPLPQLLAVKCVDGTSDLEGPGACRQHGGVGWPNATGWAPRPKQPQPLPPVPSPTP
jgi:hypothetical protein